MNKKISLVILFIVGLVLIVLDWTALHDIIKSNESSYTLEYLMLAVSIPAFVFLLWKQFSFKKKNLQNL